MASVYERLSLRDLEYELTRHTSPAERYGWIANFGLQGLEYAEFQAQQIEQEMARRELRTFSFMHRISNPTSTRFEVPAEYDTDAHLVDAHVRRGCGMRYIDEMAERWHEAYYDQLSNLYVLIAGDFMSSADCAKHVSYLAPDVFAVYMRDIAPLVHWEVR